MGSEDSTGLCRFRTRKNTRNPLYVYYPQDTPVGARSLRDEGGSPKAYDIYFILPMRLISEPWAELEAKVADVPLINPYSHLKIFDSQNGKVMVAVANYKTLLKYDVTTMKTTVLLQISAERSKFVLSLQDALATFKQENDGNQRDPFFIIILVLRHWIEDERVQEFILSDGNEIENELNAKLHITQRYASRIRSEILESKLKFNFVQEQHTKFLEFTGLKSETSARVREQLTGLLLDIETLYIALAQELNNIKTSSTWLSTSTSLKHTKAMRIAGEESRKASLALKENTDAMKDNDDLLRELAQETLESNREVKRNGDAMRQIAEESKKIAEANSKESETMTQIAVSTQKPTP
ncbi:uncharacterized protein DFL_009370 [Arthrobotrys flagrans]|uniref:Uncharacterized protein n=1 Tax=Arthrobotrys flagrans TaxID=97331 RepID=A0A436ZRX7_ARTFL|nr:hypothetical protein DFL_009370 [Arthrobotrys flagrans]